MIYGLLLFMRTFFWRYRVIPAASPGVTANNAFKPQPPAVKKAVGLQGRNHIGRAGGSIPAHRWQKWRYSYFIKLYQ